MNTTFDGAYIFGGTKGTTKPVTVDENGNLAYADPDGNGFGNANFTGTASTAGNLADIQNQLQTHLKTEISQGVVVEYNKTAVDIFKFTDPQFIDTTSIPPNPNGEVNVMDEISKLIDNLGTLSTKDDTLDKTGALSYINGEGLTKMDSIIQNLLSNRAQVGTMQNRMESAMETNEDQNYNMTDILSSSEDIDFTEKTMEYAVMQTVYTASLQTSSKVLMNTIMDYI
jgi:flagellar hook-associated protein 3 FlgL